MKPKVYITRRISRDVLLFMEKFCEVKMWEQEDVPVPRDILEQEIKDIDGLFCLLTEPIDKDLLDRAGRLKVISNMAVGYNNIDIDAATKKGIAVTNTPDVLTETTADLTFALLMTTARRISEAETFLREGKWKTWSPMLLTGQDIYGSTLGIIGLGRIGAAVARRAKGFNMKVVYNNRNRKPDLEEELGIEYAEMDDLLRASDFVCVLTPYTPDTRNLITNKHFSLMKESAILINTSRGGIVNEDALYNALVNKEIWGAGLDVFDEEPIRVDHPLLELPNVVATPHIGSASIKTRLMMAKLASENLMKILNGEKQQNVVNPNYSEFKMEGKL